MEKNHRKEFSVGNEEAIQLEAYGWNFNIVKCAAFKFHPLSRANGGKSYPSRDIRNMYRRLSFKFY